MELEEKYENLILEIYESEKERFDQDFFSKLAKNDKANLLRDIEQLIEYELVEFDKSEQAYYLTYEGYEKAERIKELRETSQQNSVLEHQNQFKKSKNQKIGAIIGAAVFTFLIIFGLYIARPNNQMDLTPELLNEIKEKVTIAMDSAQNEQILIQINSAWHWSGIDAIKILETNDFGNIIFISSNNKVFRICPEELFIENIASSLAEFEKLKLNEDFMIDWKMTKLVELAKSKEGELNQFEKYCLKIPAVISQDYSINNISKIKFAQLIAVSGDLAYQIKDLEDGQTVDLKIKE